AVALASRSETVAASQTGRDPTNLRRANIRPTLAASCARDSSTAVRCSHAASAAALRQQLAEPGGVGDRVGEALQLLVPPVALVAELVVLELRLAPAALADLEGREVEGIADIGRGQPGRIERQVGEFERGAHRRLEAQRAVEDRLAVAGVADREIRRA